MTKAIVMLIGGVIVLTCKAALAEGWGNYYGGNRHYNSSRTYNYNSYGFSNRSYGGFYSGSRRNYRHGGQIYIQNGYFKSNGTYIAPHLKTKPDNYQWNNLKNNGW